MAAEKFSEGRVLSSSADKKSNWAPWSPNGVVDQGVNDLIRAADYIVESQKEDFASLENLRDIRGLVGRLADSTAAEWALGSPRSILSPIDLRTLDVAQQYLIEASPYRLHSDFAADHPISMLRDFLSKYLVERHEHETP